MPSLGFCFPHRKGFHTERFDCSGFVFAVTVIGFCHRLTATSCLPDLANLHTVHVQCSETAALLRSTTCIKLDEKEVFLKVEDTLGPLRL